ncbi:hypothetical protein AK812_SmicGene15655 [Symbiodinium microadriaticum]|uniref:Uncharacterized protein n=1 Tax=Symbiodinium microadriaticum TaxID=2951 RepID=A0A1Q9E2C0_SYMMI|nr:hypothetical protein AK812_SmicGene15655 [Symbiodinium microadriaticum]
MAFRNGPVRSQSQIAARQSSAQLRRLEAPQERQLVNERSLKKAIEDSNNEVARVQQRRQAKAEVAEEEMTRLTVSLQQSLQDRHVLEAKLRDLHRSASRLALQRQEKEDAAEALSQEVRSKADELAEGQRRLAAARSEKEQLVFLLSEQQSTLQRLAQEAARDTAEADAVQAEAAELRARAAAEARDDLDLSRADMMRRRCLVRRAFCTFRSHVQAIKLEHLRQQRRKMIWLRKTMPGILRTWRRHTKALMRHRRRSVAAARRMREVVLAAWRRALTEAKSGEGAGGLGAAGAAERLRLDWAAKRAARRRLQGAHNAWKSAATASALHRRRLGASIRNSRRSTWFRHWSQAARRKRLSATPLHFGGTRRWWMRRVFRALRIHNFAVQFNRLRQSRSLRHCFRKLRAWAKGLRDLKAKRALREARAARALVMSRLLPAWRQTAAKLAVRRRNHAAFRRGFVQRRSWVVTLSLSNG